MDFLEKPVLEAAHRMIGDPSPTSIAPGTHLTHYEIISMIGAGGMGEVYLAEDKRLRRKVALKMLAPELTRDERGLRRFEHEAHAASALNHPNILTIHEFGQADGLHFIASEFIEGVTLRQRLVNGRLELSAAVEIAIQIASALAAAHAGGIVHRDIKPGKRDCADRRDCEGSRFWNCEAERAPGRRDHSPPGNNRRSLDQRTWDGAGYCEIHVPGAGAGS
jgi:hypothetical protein